MKRIIAAAAVAVLLLAGCQGNVADEYVGIITEATEKMQEAKTPEEANKVNDELSQQLNKFEKENEGELDKLEKDEAQSSKVRAALNAYITASIQKSIELGSQPAE